MLPPATLPAARGSVTPPGPGDGTRVPRRELRRREGPVRDAEAGLAEVMAMPAIWRDAGGRLAELPGPGSGIVVCGALPGAPAPEPAWTAEQLAAAGVAEVPGRRGMGRGWGWRRRWSPRRCWTRRWPGCRPGGCGRSRRGWRCRLPWRGRWSRGPPRRRCGGWRSGTGRPTRAMTCRRRRRCRTRTASCRSGRSCGCWPGCAGRSARHRCRACRRRAFPRRGRRPGTRSRSGCARPGGRAARGGRAAGTGCGCWPRTAPSAWSPTRRAPTGRGPAGSPATPRTSAARPAPARTRPRRSGW